MDRNKERREKRKGSRMEREGGERGVRKEGRREYVGLKRKGKGLKRRMALEVIKLLILLQLLVWVISAETHLD